MKSNILDYLLSGVVILILLLAVSLSTANLITPYTTLFFKEFHILTDGVAFFLLYGLFSALLVKICLKIHPLKQGSFSMDSTVFFYWKFITVIFEFGSYSLKPFSTFITKPMIESLYGAKMGGNIVSAGNLVDPWSITVSDNATLGLNSALVSHAITNNKIILKSVFIHKGATIGVNCVIMPGSTIGENSIVVANAVVKMDTNIPANEVWGGNPAQLIKKLENLAQPKIVDSLLQENKTISESTHHLKIIEFRTSEFNLDFVKPNMNSIKE